MKRIFISFAIEDEHLRDFLKGQAKNENSPFEFVDMSVKKPWDSQWKTNCRTRIKGCDGVISIVTKNTKNADGQIWEMKCAKDENIPLKKTAPYKSSHKAAKCLEYVAESVFDFTKEPFEEDSKENKFYTKEQKIKKQKEIVCKSKSFEESRKEDIHKQMV